MKPDATQEVSPREAIAGRMRDLSQDLVALSQIAVKAPPGALNDLSREIQGAANKAAMLAELLSPAQPSTRGKQSAPPPVPEKIAGEALKAIPTNPNDTSHDLLGKSGKEKK